MPVFRNVRAFPMSNGDNDGMQSRLDRLRSEIADDFDEELELQMEEDRLERLMGDMADHPHREEIDRKVYFRELFRLQHELVRLQDWVQHHKLKVVVLFEGRDSAGKGGAIKRITQRLNPRSAGSSPCPPPASASATSGTSSAMSPTCRPPAKSRCSTAAGTIVRASSA